MRRVMVVGALGRVGSCLVKAVEAADDLELAGAIDKDDDIAAALDTHRPEVAIDFTTPDAVFGNLEQVLARGVHAVVGTTGITDDQLARLDALALEHGVVGERYILGGENMSLAEILFEVARLTSRKPPAVRLPHLAVFPVAVASELWCRISGRGEPLATVDGVRMAMKHMYFSSAKARSELGYRSRPAAEAIADAVAWFDSREMLN